LNNAALAAGRRQNAAAYLGWEAARDGLPSTTLAGTHGPGWNLFAGTLAGPGDITGDGIADLVTLHGGVRHRWFGDGSGSVSFAGTVGPGWTPHQSTLMGVGDLNRDGRGDLLAVHDMLHRWVGLGGASFVYAGGGGPGWAPYFAEFAANSLPGTPPDWSDVDAVPHQPGQGHSGM
jgi:hypothetical protein